MITTAVIDDLWRYVLTRVWDDTRPMLVVCMLNPSTADHEKNDPTILTLIWFAQQWGYGGLCVVNEYAFRSSSPAEMMRAIDPVGPANAWFVEDAIIYARDHGGRALAAWGNGGTADNLFVRKAVAHGVELICLGTTQSGAPKHPLARGHHRIPRDQQPIVWRPYLLRSAAAASFA